MSFESEILLYGPGYRILRRDVDVRAARSSGPGGQNVNKVSSKVILYFHVDEAEGISPYVRRRLHELYDTRISKRGMLIVASDIHRDRPRNLEAALARLDSFLRSAAHRPKVRKKTKIPRRAKEHRLKKKRITSGKKVLRGHVGINDE